MYVCMYVVSCKIDHYIHIHWCIPMGLGHNDYWVDSHMWLQQTWGQMPSRGQWPLVQFFWKKKSLYLHTLMYFMGLGCNDPWVESHMWPQQTWDQRSFRGQWPLAKFLKKKGHCIHILWRIFMGIGYNDPWVESHMWLNRSGVKGYLRVI